ncbi:IST1-like protein [Frankliniella fusca]|uniref:IST1 homolog n=1 Tax=Frankliniella fusca TaxID=407009 RepID=A0AAE1LGG1_9NEOP|nr:IST1-like protein [Frankliniella fusca]
MFSSGPNYTKLKTHLRLAINRLKLLEKKKTELAQKARKEIADYLAAGKIERARIRVEHIIREDYIVEAFEVVEMYCDLLLARFGLLQQMKTLDEGLAEAISSILWVAPRIQSDIQEMSVITDQLAAKYGRQYVDACREDAVGSISEKLKHKMSVQAPPKLLVEKYLIEIAKNYNIEFTPDPQVMREEEPHAGEDVLLLDLDQDKNNLGGGGIPQPAGFIGFPQPPMIPSDFQPFNYPAPKPSAGSSGGFVVPPPLPQQGPAADANAAPAGSSSDRSAVPFNVNPASMSYNIPPGGDSSSNVNNMQDSPPPSFHSLFPPDVNRNKQSSDHPKPAPRSKLSPGDDVKASHSSGMNFHLPDLPSVPSSSFPPDEVDGRPGADDIDFDDLTRRFEELKKKK